LPHDVLLSRVSRIEIKLSGHKEIQKQKALEIEMTE